MRQTLLASLLFCALMLACSHSTSVVQETIQPIDLAYTSAQDEPSSFESFKREMMPHVGQKTTVVGVLKSGKLGYWIDYKDWGVYIYATKDHDVAKMNELDRLFEHMVEVTGTLQYFPEPPAPKSAVVVAIPPKHFYFDVAEAKVTSLKPPPRSKRSDKNRVKKSS
jgi:hypothetical protein